MQMMLGHLNFKDKRVVIMGLGVYPHGTGIAAVKFFLSRGARILITDLKTKKKLAPRVREVMRIWSAHTGRARKPTFVLGRHRLHDFLAADYIFQNPSVPADSPFLSRAQQSGIPILNDWSIFLNAHRPQLFIGVTGTRGKSTTTALIYRMLRRRHRQVRLCGNIGVSPLTFIDTYRGEPVVAELSSWLLHHFASVRVSPHIAVVTNIMADHLNKYPSMHAYIRDKENIFLYQHTRDTVVLNADNPATRAMDKRATGRVCWFSVKKHMPAWVSLKKYALKGEHNASNALAAATAAHMANVPKSDIVAALKTFRGLPDRFERVRTLHGVAFINDTTATTPDATIAGLRTARAATKRRTIVLIAGGADKKLGYRLFAESIQKYCKALVLLPGSATKKMLREALKLKLAIPVVQVADMRRAVRAAHTHATRGDTVLLSPGAASFGLFINEFDRGRAFLKAIQQLK